STKVSIKRLLQGFRAQQSSPTTAFSEPPASLDIVPINNGRGPSLLELRPMQCRWPFGTPGTEDFCYCGHDAPEGLSYCLGHASIAYRMTRRSRVSAGSYR